MSPYVVKCNLALFSFCKVQRFKIFILVIIETKYAACFVLFLILYGDKFRFNIYILLCTFFRSLVAILITT